VPAPLRVEPSGPTRKTKTRKPALYRLRRILLISAVIVTVLIVILMAFVCVSFLEFVTGITNNHCSSQDESQSNSQCYLQSNFNSAQLEYGNSLVYADNFSISNDGFFAVSNFQFSESLSLSSGVVLGKTSTPAVTIPGGSSKVISPEPPLTVNLGQEPGAVLLTQDENLTATIGVNASYADFFSISIQGPQNVSWGAPFANYTVVAGPTTTSGGSNQVTVEVSFVDRATFVFAGIITLKLFSPTKQQCGSTTLPVDLVGNGFVFDQTTSPVTLASGCDPHGGGQMASSFSSIDLDVALPSQVVQ
jgi:hypothetical protein